MDIFKEKLKIQSLIFSICCFILAVFCFLPAASEFGFIPELAPAAGNSHWQSMWRGFASGASFGIFALMVIGLVRNIRAMRSEKELKKLFVKENDERLIHIWTAARAASMQAFLLLGLVGTIVAGYFSVAVSLTILACVFSCSLVSLGFKLYFSKKF